MTARAKGLTALKLHWRREQNSWQNERTSGIWTSDASVRLNANVGEDRRIRGITGFWLRSQSNLVGSGGARVPD